MRSIVFKKMFLICFVFFLLPASIFSSEQDFHILNVEGIEWLQRHTLFGVPLGTPDANKLIVRPIYAMSNNSETKFADWVAYRLDKHSVCGDVKTQRQWKADPALDDTETLEPSDYKGAHATLNIDRGHQAPLASFKGTKWWCQTNYLSNITPQCSDLNQGPWKLLEDAVRELARKQVVYVITGPLYEREMPNMPEADENHRVPSGYWKIIAVEETGNAPIQLAAFIFDQGTARLAKVIDHLVSVDEVESRSGLDFFWQLPDGLESEVEASVGSLQMMQ